ILSDNQPDGFGYGTIKVDSAGKIRFVGSLADGTKVSQSTVISKTGAWPLYVGLTGGGSILSWQTFANQASDDIHGAWSWIKAANPLSRYSPGGFAGVYDAIGSKYVIPPLGTTVLGITQAEIDFAGGNLSGDFGNLVTIGAASTISNNSSNALSMAFV